MNINKKNNYNIIRTRLLLIPIIYLFLTHNVLAEVNTNCEPQCIKHVKSLLPLNSKWKDISIGSAKDWWTKENDECLKGNIPIVKSIIVFNSWEGNPFGHVGVVANINNDLLVIDHANWGTEANAKDCRVAKDTFTLIRDNKGNIISLKSTSNKTYPIIGFIYAWDIGINDILNLKYDGINFINGEFKRGNPFQGTTDYLYKRIAKSEKNEYYVKCFDIDNDKHRDVIVAMYTNYGGSGSFLSLVTFLNKSGKLLYKDSIDLGQVVIKSIKIVNGKLKVIYLKHGPNDPMCCPTVLDSKLLNIKSGFFSPAFVEPAISSSSIVISPNACPFEGCQLGNWVAQQTVRVYDKIEGKVIKQISVNETVNATYGEIRALPQKAIVTGTYKTDEEQGIKIGSIIYVLHPIGEGAVAVWKDGNIINGSLDLTYKYEDSIKSNNLHWTWWVKVLLNDGTNGWLKNPQGQFHGMDAFG